MSAEKLALPIIALAICSVLAGPVTARTWHVPTECPTIQAGIDSAVAGDVVEVACGTYNETGIVMGSGITLRSESGNPDCVTIMGSPHAGCIMYCNEFNNQTFLEGITFMNGSNWNNSEAGGGLTCVNSNLSISNCSIFGNTSYCDGNDQYPGGPAAAGGLFCVNSNLHLSYCKFEQNTGHGAGAEISDSSPVFEYCEFVGNHAGGRGATAGAIRIFNSSPQFFNCSFMGNTTAIFRVGAGAMYFNGGNPYLENCSIQENEIEGMSGGILIENGCSLSAFNTDIANNYNGDGHISLDSSAQFECCDINMDQWIVEDGGTLVLDNSDCTGLATESKTWGGVKALYR